MSRILITGASGFIGKHMVDYFISNHTVFAIARRSRKASGVPYHPNLHWLQCDIGNNATVGSVKDYIINNGGIDFVIHLAAYYDFSYKDNPEYERTNVTGTKNILDLAKECRVSRFIFSSSLAACEFPYNGTKITERSSPDAAYPYAASKKKGEVLVKEYSQYFPCTNVRFAAVYSDWCEFAPLYKFLSTWLSQNFDSRLLAGRGESAIPYIHVREIINLFEKIIKNTNELENFETFSASYDGSTSHREIFQIATRYFFGRLVKPIYMPKLLTYPGLFIKLFLSKARILFRDTFERPWMIHYIDKKLDIDSSYTRAKLNWEPNQRYHLIRRLPFLLEKIKSHSSEWTIKNEAALSRAARHANYVIYEHLISNFEYFIDNISIQIDTGLENNILSKYKKMDPHDFKCYLSTLLHLLTAAVRSGDRGLMLAFVDDIALRRFAEGFIPVEINAILSIYSKSITSTLLSVKALKPFQQDIYDYIGLTIQLAQDEVEDLYEKLLEKMPRERISDSSMLPDCKKLQKLIRQLSAFYQIAPDEVKKELDTII